MIIVIRRKRILLSRAAALLALPLFLTYSSCGNEDATADHLEFEVVDSLLEPMFSVESACVSFRPPAGFEPVDDSLKEALVAMFRERVPEGNNLNFAEFFFSEQYSSAVIVSIAQGLSLESDTASFAAKYLQSLSEFHGAGNVVAGDFWVNDVYVKNHLIEDSLNVHFHLLCLSYGRDAIELQYVIARPFYAKILKSLESSMGSINLIKQGGN